MFIVLVGGYKLPPALSPKGRHTKEEAVLFKGTASSYYKRLYYHLSTSSVEEGATTELVATGTCVTGAAV